MTVPRIIQMIKDSIAIQRGYRNQSRQTSPSNFWWMSRGDRRRRIKAWYKQLDMM